MNIENFVNEYLKEYRHDILLNPYNGLIAFAEQLRMQMLKNESVDAKVVGKDVGNRTILRTDSPTDLEMNDVVSLLVVKHIEA